MMIRFVLGEKAAARLSVDADRRRLSPEGRLR